MTYSVKWNYFENNATKISTLNFQRICVSKDAS